MYVFVSVYFFTCLVYLASCPPKRNQACVCVCMYIYLYIRVGVGVCVFDVCMPVCMNAHVDVCTYLCKYVLWHSMYLCKYVYVYMRIPACMYLYM